MADVNVSRDLEVTTATDYFERIDKEIDWESTSDPEKIPLVQYDTLQKVLSAEIAEYLMRHTVGIDGSICDDMAESKIELRNAYEKKYGAYVKYNVF